MGGPSVLNSIHVKRSILLMASGIVQNVCLSSFGQRVGSMLHFSFSRTFSFSCAGGNLTFLLPGFTQQFGYEEYAKLRPCTWTT